MMKMSSSEPGRNLKTPPNYDREWRNIFELSRTMN